MPQRQEWFFQTPAGSVVLTPRGQARNGDDRRALDAGTALRFVARQAREPGARSAIQSLRTWLGTPPWGNTGTLERFALEAFDRELARALERGDLVALRTEHPGLAMIAVENREEKGPEDPPDEQHTLDFLVQYADGAFASELDYILVDPGGKETTGKLGGDGKVHKDGVKPGSYTLILKEVERVSFSQMKIRCDEEVTLSARTAGAPDGTAVKFRLFREFAESDKDVVDTVQGSVHADAVEAVWKYDYAKDDARKKEQGVAHFIAEASFDGGKYWAKTPVALQVQLKSVTSARWMQDCVFSGEKAMLIVATKGFADGETLKVELWKHGVVGPDKKVADLADLTVRGDQAGLEVPFVHKKDGSAPAGTIGRVGEYRCVVKYQSDVERTLRSPWLRCEYATEHRSEGAGESTSAGAGESAAREG